MQRSLRLCTFLKKHFVFLRHSLQTFLEQRNKVSDTVMHSFKIEFNVQGFLACQEFLSAYIRDCITIISYKIKIVSPKNSKFKICFMQDFFLFSQAAQVMKICT
jgi:hypothetical protein